MRGRRYEMSVVIDISHWESYRFERGTRYYSLSLLQDLWGEWVIEKINGRIEGGLGKIRHEPCENYEEGRVLLQKYRRYRVLKRRYEELK